LRVQQVAFSDAGIVVLDGKPDIDEQHSPNFNPILLNSVPDAVPVMLWPGRRVRIIIC
jgi:hypothetical protein